MATFGTKAINLIFILASLQEISDAIQDVNPVPKILLDVGSVVPRGFVVRALKASFVNTSPIWIQLWNGTSFLQGHTGNYTLIWQVEARGKQANGSLELVQFGENKYINISDEGVHLAVYSLVRPSALNAVFSPSVGNLHMSNIDHCQRKVKSSGSYALSVNVSCTFDKLRWPYALPLKLCNSPDCSDLSVTRRWPTVFSGHAVSASTAPETSQAPTTPKTSQALTTLETSQAPTAPETSQATTALVTTTSQKRCSDEHSEEIKVTHDRDVSSTSSVDLRNTVIGLIIWNVFLSVLLLIVAASVLIAHSNISHLKRIHWHNRGMYVINKEKKNTEADDRREGNGPKRRDFGLSAI